MIDRQRQRMQAILRDRFGLVLRVETRQLPMYALVEAKGGHKLKTPDGPFDLKLEWKPDTVAAGPGSKEDAVEVEGASIFTALTEQLGLRLESKKGPVTVYVVEKAEKPGDN